MKNSNANAPDSVVLPPSLHMRLGNGLANISTSQWDASCFESSWDATFTTEGKAKEKRFLSESDLFSVLNVPTIDATSKTDNEELERCLSPSMIQSSHVKAES